MKRLLCVGLSLIVSLYFLPSFALEKLWYITDDFANSTFLGKNKLQKMADHAQQINVLSPQNFTVDAQGLMSGSIDPSLLALAKDKKIKLMPLVSNQDFSQELAHTLLSNTAYVQQAINEMVQRCQVLHLYGLQLDFEGMNIADKDAFTHFVQLAATALHQAGFVLSVAVIPRGENIFYTDFDRWYYENWSGVYDYKQLAMNADFLTLMSYDRHTSLTTPGPVAPLVWVEKTLHEILEEVPANKIFLGVPSYSAYWSTGQLGVGKMPAMYSFRAKESEISYADVQALISKFHLTLTWNNDWQSAYSLFTNHERVEYVFIEDAKSAAFKVALAKRYHLRGIAIWKLGLEDDALWQAIK